MECVVGTGELWKTRMASLIAGLLAIGGGAVLGAGCSDDSERFVGRRPSSPESQETERTQPVTEPDKTATISWTGCGISKVAYMVDAAREYKKETGVTIVLTGGGATRGIRAAAGGNTDIGGSCRHCLPEYSDQEKDAVMTHVAWDALVFFTHVDNPVNGISRAQAKAILLGEIDNWNEVDGPDAPIIRVFRRQTADGKLSGVGHMTRLLLFKDASVQYTSDALFERSSGPIEQYVEKTEFAFAVTGVSSAKKRQVKILKLDGIYPHKPEIESGEYGLFRPLYLITRGEPTGLAKGFLEWILSERGQAVLSAAGTVNLVEGEELETKYQYWPKQAGAVRNR